MCNKMIPSDVSKLLPKFRADFKSIEQLVVTQSTKVDGADMTDDALILALASRLSKHYDVFNEINMWYIRMSGNVAKKKRKVDA